MYRSICLYATIIQHVTVSVTSQITPPHLITQQADVL